MLLALNRWLKGASRKSPNRRNQNRSTFQLLKLEERTTPAIAAALASGPGIISRVDVLDENGTVLTSFQPYQNSFLGGVNVALADVTGDGVLDIITGAGYSSYFPNFLGGPHVQVFDGAGLLGGNDRPLHSFFPYAQNFTGGVFVAGGDLDGDGFADVVCGQGEGGTSQVTAWKFDNATFEPIQRMLSFTGFTNPDNVTPFGDNGGIAGSRTAGDAEIVLVPGPGGGPLVRLFDYANLLNPNLPLEFNPDNYGNFYAQFGIDNNYRGSFYVAGGYFTANRDGDGFIYADIVISAGGGSLNVPIDGGSPHVLTYRLDGFFSPDRLSGATYILANEPPGIDDDTGLPENVTPNSFAYSFFPFDLDFHGGISVGVITVPASNTSNATDNIIVGTGPNILPPPGVALPPTVKIYDGITGAILNEFTAFGDPNFNGGVVVA